MNSSFSFYHNIEQFVLKKLQKIPLIGFYAKTRGWYYVFAWGHRAAGALLVIYLWFHIHTLTLLRTPDVFAGKMELFQEAFFVFLEWTLAIPVIFHALNGGRLVLYEAFYSKADAAVARGVVVFSFLYVGLLGWMMMMGDQSVSPVFFWLCLLGISISLSYIVALKLCHAKNSTGWKLQRITGVFLLPMIPAHLLFMHLNPAVGHDAEIIIARMQHGFIKVVTLSLLIAIIFHSVYGIISIIKDYINTKALEYCIILVILIIMGFFLFAGARLTLFI